MDYFTKLFICLLYNYCVYYIIINYTHSNPSMIYVVSFVSPFNLLFCLWSCHHDLGKSPHSYCGTISALRAEGILGLLVGCLVNASVTILFVSGIPKKQPAICPPEPGPQYLHSTRMALRGSRAIEKLIKLLWLGCLHWKKKQGGKKKIFPKLYMVSKI